MASRRNNNSNKRRFSPEALRETAIEAQGQLAGVELEAGDEVFLIPHPLMLDDDAQERLERFQASADLDRDENGELVVPFKINGELAEPATTRMAKAVMGEESHARFVAAGGHSNDVQLAWNYMVVEYQRAEADDPK